MSRISLSPLLQLNIFLHAGMDYPQNSIFNPVFKRMGYFIKTIGQGIPVEALVQKKIIESLGIAVSSQVVPEIIFENVDTRHLILLECKMSSFSATEESRDRKQAVGYLSLTEKYISEFLGKRFDDVHGVQMTYSVIEAQSDSLSQTLKVLSSKIQDAIGSTLSNSVIGMESRNDGIYLVFSDGLTKEYIRVVKTSSENTGSILYVIPVDPDINFKDDYGKKVLEERVRSIIRSQIGRYVGYAEHKFSDNDICKQVIPVWEMWSSNSKKKMRQLIRSFIKSIAEDLRKRGLNIVYKEGGYRVPLVNKSASEKIRNYLKSPRYLDIGNNVYSSLDQGEIEEVLIN